MLIFSRHQLFSSRSTKMSSNSSCVTTPFDGLTNNDGYPIYLIIWESILKFVLISSEKENSLRTLKQLLIVCKMFNVLPVLRRRLRSISCMMTNPNDMFPNDLMRMDLSRRMSYRTPWGLYESLGKYVPYVNGQTSHNLFGIVWTDFGRYNPDKAVRWRSPLPIWFFVRNRRLKMLDGVCFPGLKVPMITMKKNHAMSVPTAAEKQHLTHNQLQRMTEYWVHLHPQPFDLTVLNADLPKSEDVYYLFVLGSPFNLYSQGIKMEPDAKLTGTRVCYLVYVLRTNTQYSIKAKNTNPYFANKSLDFRTNLFA